jgi:hypothetical protein
MILTWSGVRLEDKIRYYAQREMVYITGSILNEKLERIGSEMSVVRAIL